MNRLSTTFIPSSFQLTKTCYPTTTLLFRRYSLHQKYVKRKYPIGISDFKKIKEEKYMWDRTKFLKDFYEDSNKSILILRPRRWGKTTTVSMAKYYFNKNVEDPELAKRLFTGTLIEEEKEFVSRTQGLFPVISISFGGCFSNNWTGMKQMLLEIICIAYREHRYLEDSDFFHYDAQIQFRRILNGDPTVVYEIALKTLTELLYRYHGKRVIVLIDEYELPLNQAYMNGYYEEALPFLSSAFTGVLKDNHYLEKGLLTGILRVVKTGYLSGLNDLCVYSLLDKRYADVYGVQEKELEEALEHEGLADKADEVKSYYGYNSGIPSLLLCNTWSILNYLVDKELNPYWIQSGSIDFIANAIWSAPTVQQNMLPLLNGESLLVPVEIDINFKIHNSPSTLWSLLYHSGYLTGQKVDERTLKIRIPNTEVNNELSVLWRHVIYLKGFGSQYEELIDALLSGNQHLCEYNLRILARELFSMHVGRLPSFWYQFVLSIYPLKIAGYKIDCNCEAGLGRAHIVLYAPTATAAVGKPDIIIQLDWTRMNQKERKKVKSDDLPSDAENIIQQIFKQDYFNIFKSKSTNKRAILWGIACVRKVVAVSVKEYTI